MTPAIDRASAALEAMNPTDRADAVAGAIRSAAPNDVGASIIAGAIEALARGELAASATRGVHDRVQGAPPLLRFGWAYLRALAELEDDALGAQCEALHILERAPSDVLTAVAEHLESRAVVADLARMGVRIKGIR